MAGETNFSKLVKGMIPYLNKGEYVFCTLKDVNKIDRSLTLGEFKEVEGTTVILERNKADELNLSYNYISSWITLTIHSSLEAVGLTAAFSSELAKEGISCNVIAGYYHDHIFIDATKAQKAMQVLTNLSKNNRAV